MNLFPFSLVDSSYDNPFPIITKRSPHLRFSNIMFTLHNNEVNVKRKAQEDTGVYREILSRTAIKTIAYVHSATCRYKR